MVDLVKETNLLNFICLVLIGCALSTHAMMHHYNFVVTDAPYNRLCSNKSILTVNGQFPGPTIHVTQGDTIVIDVVNRAKENITIHWHGVKQLRYPWSDGPEYITQCPIQPGSKFHQKIILTDEIGTLWWHAHNEWSRATVHGTLIVYPRIPNDYPFPPFHQDIPIILGEWWKSDIKDVLREFVRSGGDPNVSDAFLINGQPGDLYQCSTNDTFKVKVEFGKTYLFRMVNAVMNNIMFFKIVNHNVTIVGSDASYVKSLNSDYITISPGQTIDFLLVANQRPSHYYMASRPYASAGLFSNTTTTGRIEYVGNYTPPSSLLVPTFPDFNDTLASVNFTNRLRSLASKDHPIDVPLRPSTNLFFTLSINLVPCENNGTCLGPFNERLSASVNNVSFVLPRVSILQAYYDGIRGVYDDNFFKRPPLRFNFTAPIVPRELWRRDNGTRVRLLSYNDTVELVFQGTNTVVGIDHPMHLHGHSFYVVGSGFGNFDKDKDPLNYNLVDPPLQNTIAVPRSGWTAIRFRANNPGVWLMHCHFERHVSWGMQMVFIVKNGNGPNATMLPPPRDFPQC